MREFYGWQKIGINSAKNRHQFGTIGKKSALIQQKIGIRVQVAEK